MTHEKRKENKPKKEEEEKKRLWFWMTNLQPWGGNANSLRRWFGCNRWAFGLLAWTKRPCWCLLYHSMVFSLFNLPLFRTPRKYSERERESEAKSKGWGRRYSCEEVGDGEVSWLGPVVLRCLGESHCSAVKRIRCSLPTLLLLTV